MWFRTARMSSVRVVHVLGPLQITVSVAPQHTNSNPRNAAGYNWPVSFIPFPYLIPALSQLPEAGGDPARTTCQTALLAVILSATPVAVVDAHLGEEIAE
jgi:hypothetical protein